MSNVSQKLSGFISSRADAEVSDSSEDDGEGLFSNGQDFDAGEEETPSWKDFIIYTEDELKAMTKNFRKNQFEPLWNGHIPHHLKDSEAISAMLLSVSLLCRYKMHLSWRLVPRNTSNLRFRLIDRYACFIGSATGSSYLNGKIWSFNDLLYDTSSWMTPMKGRCFLLGKALLAIRDKISHPQHTLVKVQGLKDWSSGVVTIMTKKPDPENPTEIMALVASICID